MSAKATWEVSILEPLCILKQLRDLLNYYKFSWNFIRATKSQIGEAKKKKKKPRLCASKSSEPLQIQ